MTPDPRDEEKYHLAAVPIPMNTSPRLDFYADPFATEEENLILYSHAVYEYTRQ